MVDNGGNPDGLMSLKPEELKKLRDGEFRMYVGIKFAALENSYHKLDNRLWYLMGLMVSTMGAVFLSIML